MKREDLTAKLKAEYKPTKNDCGVVKGDTEGYKHVWFVMPPPPSMDRPSDLPLKALAKAHAVLERLPYISEADELDKIVSYLFIRREAVQSSRMEGTYSTIDQVLTPGEIWEDEERRAERSSVLGYAMAIDREIEQCLKKGISIFDIQLVCRIHKSIMAKEPRFKGKPGAIRAPGDERSYVWIGGGGRVENSIYNPAPPKFVKQSLQSVLDWMSDKAIEEMGNAGMGLTLPLRLAIGHSHFEAVHPFADGNGRVGRVLMTLQMACTGKIPVYISGYVEAEKQEYMSALGLAQKKLQYGPIIEFICEAIAASHAEAEATKSTIRLLPNEWVERGKFRAKSAAQRALSVIFMNPIFTARTIEEKLEVSTPAAMRAVKQLLEAGIVRERTGYSRNRVFAAEEVIEIMARDFGSPVTEAKSAAKGLMNSLNAQKKPRRRKRII